MDDLAAHKSLHSDCRAHGNVLDLWAAFHGLTLREAALHLADTFKIHLPKKKASSRPTQH
jgi:DNA primase